MSKCLFIITALLLCVTANAQQPPAQLPSLIDSLDAKMPVLHKGQSPEELIRTKIFVKAETDTKSVYAGEPFLVEYKLYTALGSQARISRQPLFSGCSVLELDAPDEPSEQVINGSKWQVFTIRKVQLTPLEEGQLLLDKVYVDNVVQLINEQTLEVENFSTQISNDPVTVEVKPLPANGKPGRFTGLVGDYTIKASVDSNNIPVGENATLRITISGTGNIGAIRMPTVQWPAGTEHFEGTDTQFVNQERFPVKGYKTFEIPFISNKEGKIEIAPVEFSFFDAASRSYKTISSNSIQVTIVKALSRTDQLNNVVTEDVSNRKYIWIVGAIAAVVVAVWQLSAWSKKKRSKAEVYTNDEQEKKSSQPKQAIAETDPAVFLDIINRLGSEQQNQQAFFSGVKNLLARMVSEKTGSIYDSEHSMLAALKQHAEYRHLYTDCQKILAQCNHNLYSPFADVHAKESIYFDSVALIKAFYRHQSVNL